MRFPSRRLFLVVSLLAAATLTASGCSSTTPPSSACPEGQTLCDSRCVDTAVDAANCGACGAACASGQVCSAGVCALSCPPGLSECGGSCRDFTSDRSNCGACGTACVAGEVCDNGTCAADCSASSVECDGRCVDPKTDRAHCGATGDCLGANGGTACASGFVCADGQCALSCPPNTVECGGTCIDPKTSRPFCGASGDCTGANAGTFCASGEVCLDGVCSLSCQTGFVNCGGKCVDPLTDRAFCGATDDCQGANAGVACASGEVCDGAGACALSCQSGFVNCGGKCIDPETDRAFCGATGDCAGANAGKACASGEVCGGSTAGCVLSCQSGLTDCGGECVNLLTDNRYCSANGTCGTAQCPSGTVCDGTGACAVSCQSNLTDCGGSCVDLTKDDAHCGACGTTCTANQRCVGGTCATLCPSGTSVCGGTCRNLATDSKNCGSCGNVCGGSTICSNGACYIPLVTTPPVVASGALTGCTLTQSASRKVAVDQTGNIYVGFMCNQSAYVAVSNDGGATFAAPVSFGPVGPPITNPGAGAELTLTGGSGSTAHLAFANSSGALFYARTTDAGATWSTATQIDTGIFAFANLSIIAPGSDVWIGTQPGSGTPSGAFHLLHNAASGVGTFSVLQAPLSTYFCDVLRDELSGDLYVFCENGAFARTTNGGVTFTTGSVSGANGGYGDEGLGFGRAVLTNSNGQTERWALPLTPSETPVVLGGVPSSTIQMSSLAMDTAGTSFIAGSQGNTVVLVRHLATASTTPTDIRTLGTTGDIFPVVVAPRPNVAVVAFVEAGKVKVTVQSY